MTEKALKVIPAALLALLCNATGSMAAPASGEATRRALLLHVDSALLPGAVLAERGIRGRLDADGVPTEYLTEHVDLAWNPDAETVERVRRSFQLRTDGRAFDVVFAVGARALRFAAGQRAALFPGAPIVFCSVTPAGLAAIGPPGDVSGVVMAADASATLRAAARLQPGLRRAVLVAGAGDVDRVYLDDVRRDLEADPPGLELSTLAGLPLEDARAQLARFPDDTVALFVSMSKDGAGRTLTSPEALRALRAASAVPIYGLAGTVLGHGIVGGWLVDFEAQAAQAAGLAVARLRAPGPYPGVVERARNEPRFDAAELRAWSLDRARLPAGSVLINEPPPAWQLYRGPIVAAAAVVALQAGLIGALLVQRARRRGADERVREMGARLVRVREEERRRIARELHDDAGQRLASMSLEMSALKKRMAGIPGAGDALTALQLETVRLTEDLRQLSRELHPAVLEQAGLVEAIRARSRELAAEIGVPVIVVAPEPWGDVPPESALCLYRVAQEGLRNVARHAQATTARLVLTRRRAALEMRIADDGRGFEPGADGAAGGLGLTSMAERVRLLGGSFAVRSAPAGGTELEVSLPAEGRT